MNKEQRIESFSFLGRELRAYLDGSSDTFKEHLDQAIDKAFIKNSWFEPKFSKSMLKEISDWLLKENLTDWLSRYEAKGDFQKNVAVIAAGNIPFVAFHDVLCVLISGHSLILKCSSDDAVLIPKLLDMLVEIEPQFKDKFEIKENLRDKGFDAVIATGSSNSSRYFDYYFSKYPHIIRKNRNGVAVINGDESAEELKALGEDIFNYFGLGCRNVSKLYVPKSYKFDFLYESIFEFQWVLDNRRYNDNYQYNRTIYLLNGAVDLLDNGFLLLKKDEGISSPVGVLFWEEYSDLDELNEKLKKSNEALQCRIGKQFEDFGQSQSPAVDEYADGIDTMKFLDDLLTTEAL